MHVLNLFNEGEKFECEMTERDCASQCLQVLLGIVHKWRQAIIYGTPSFSYLAQKEITEHAQL